MSEPVLTEAELCNQSFNLQVKHSMPQANNWNASYIKNMDGSTYYLPTSDNYFVVVARADLSPSLYNQPVSSANTTPVSPGVYISKVRIANYQANGAKGINSYGWYGSNCPSPTPTPSVTATPSITPTLTQTVTQTPTLTQTVTPTNTATITQTNTSTPTPTISETSTPTVTPTVTPSTSQTVFYYTMSPCDGVSPNFTAQSNTSKTIGTAWNITGGPNVGVCATIIAESVGPSTDIIGLSCSCVTPTPTPSVTESSTPTVTPSNTVTPSVTPSVSFYYYNMSPCDGVSPNFVARSSQSGLSGTYEVSGSGYAGVIATIVGSTVAPHVATLLGASSCSSPTPTPTRTPTPTPSYNYYNVRSLRPDCTGLLPGTNEVLQTTQNLSTGTVVGPSPGQCYEIQGTTSPQTPDYTGPWSVFVSCGVCQTP